MLTKPTLVREGHCACARWMASCCLAQEAAKQLGRIRARSAMAHSGLDAECCVYSNRPETLELVLMFTIRGMHRAGGGQAKADKIFELLVPLRSSESQKSRTQSMQFIAKCVMFDGINALRASEAAQRYPLESPRRAPAIHRGAEDSSLYTRSY